MADKRKAISTSSSDRSFLDSQDPCVKPAKRTVKKAKTSLSSTQSTLSAFKLDSNQLKRFGEEMMKAITNLESKVCCVDQKLSGMVTMETLN